MYQTTTINNLNGPQQPIYQINNLSSSVKSANSVPSHNASNFVDETHHSYKKNNSLQPNYMKQVYSPLLAPSNGSTTESFLKSKSLLSSNYRHNESVTKYEFISKGHLKLYQMQKKIDLFI